MVRWLVALLCAWCAVAAVPAGQPVQGTFALQGGVAATKAYLVAGPAASDPLALRFDLWMTPLDSRAAIRSYDVDMTKMLHAVIVSDDFTTFVHAHPKLEASGHFVAELRLPKPGAYQLFADGEPSGVGQQVFRFEVGTPSGDPSRRDLSERSPIAVVDGYTVSISSLALKAGTESMLEVHIRRGGKPATDLHPYLGALAHAVFIDATDLTYVHAHPVPLGGADDMRGMAGMKGMSDTKAMDASGASAPDMALHVRVVEPGTYKLWLQFAGGSRIHVAQFVLSAS
jgi:hypothetical protein